MNHILGRFALRRARRAAGSGWRRPLLGVLATALASAATVALAPAASAASAPPPPNAVFRLGTNLALGQYVDIIVQRPLVRRYPEIARNLSGELPLYVGVVCGKTPNIPVALACLIAVNEGVKRGGLMTMLDAYNRNECFQTRISLRDNRLMYFSVQTHPAWCYRDVYGSIGVKWMEHGGRGGWLGYATTDELPTPNKPGRYNHFQHGSIYWSQATGAHEVHGAIRQKWASMGWENSLLGFPTSDERATPNKLGRYNTFENGIIYFSHASGTHEVHGSILGHYRDLGYENSRLGFPTTDEFALPGGGRQQYFQNGCRIEWRPGVPGRGTVAICN